MVVERCQAPLSIGKYYKDKLIYHIMGVEVYHLVFNKPWEFDCYALHNGRNDMYKFFRDFRE